MSDERELQEAIKKLSGFEDMEFESAIATVSDIDLSANTCTCTPINGMAAYYDVILSVDKQKGFLLIPKNNSLVVVSQLSENTAYLSMVSEVDQVYIAGDANGGIVKVTELTAKLNTLITQLTAQLALISTGIAAGGGSYTPGTLSTFNKTDFENNIVKHGNG